MRCKITGESNMKIWTKVHEGAQGKVVAACDESLLGKKLEQDTLSLHVNEKFYKGDLVEEEALAALLKDKENINLVGENTVRIAKDNDLIKEVSVINGIPYALIFKL